MFTFSLQEVLDYRLQVREDCEREYQRSALRWQEAEAELNRLREKRARTLQKFHEDAQRGWNPTVFGIYYHYVDELKHRIAAQDQVTQQQEAEAAKYRERLMQAMREVEIMERLKDEAHSDFEYQERKKEEKAMSELALFNFARRRREKISVTGEDYNYE